MILTDDVIWKHCHLKDLWIFDKLILSQVLGYRCGPVGLQVPEPDFYCIRPITNVLGMGRYARIEWIQDSTDHYHPGEFWCEVFEGEHLSVDYYQKQSVLVVRGEREKNAPLYQWKKWERLEKQVEFPQVLNELYDDYEWINCEFIGDKLIEVHFRSNPDFVYNNSVAIPIWEGAENEIKNEKNYKYITCSDYHRIGFLIDEK